MLITMNKNLQILLYYLHTAASGLPAPPWKTDLSVVDDVIPVDLLS